MKTTIGKKEYRVLPDDVYFALMLSALAFEGIGKGVFSENAHYKDVNSIPCCIHGHARVAAGSYAEPYRERSFGRQDELIGALDAANVSYIANDNAVNGDERISFREFCKRLNVIPQSEADARLAAQEKKKAA